MDCAIEPWLMNFYGHNWKIWMWTMFIKVYENRMIFHKNTHFSYKSVTVCIFSSGRAGRPPPDAVLASQIKMKPQIGKPCSKQPSSSSTSGSSKKNFREHGHLFQYHGYLIARRKMCNSTYYLKG